MIIKCHRCEKPYQCDLDQYQGLCPYCETIRVAKFKAGTRYIDKDGDIWVRMADDINRHIEDYLFNLKTGKIYHVSRVVYRDRVRD